MYIIEGIIRCRYSDTGYIRGIINSYCNIIVAITTWAIDWYTYNTWAADE